MSNNLSNMVHPNSDWIVLASVTMTERNQVNDLLYKPSLIICNANPTMGVLCSLTVGRDKIDQSRLKRIVGYY